MINGKPCKTVDLTVYVLSNLVFYLYISFPANIFACYLLLLLQFQPTSPNDVVDYAMHQRSVVKESKIVTEQLHPK